MIYTDQIEQFITAHWLETPSDALMQKINAIDWHDTYPAFEDGSLVGYTDSDGDLHQLDHDGWRIEQNVKTVLADWKDGKLVESEHATEVAIVVSEEEDEEEE